MAGLPVFLDSVKKKFSNCVTHQEDHPKYTKLNLDLSRGEVKKICYTVEMKRKTGPYMLLIILIAILVFIGGVRYGQRVETANKEISTQLSITPTEKAAKEDLRFTTYSNKACGIRFLYPTSLKLNQQASTSAQFKEDGDTALAFSCGKSDPFEKGLEEIKTATQEITFQDKKVVTTIQKDGTVQKFFLTIQNPQTRQPLYFMVTDHLYPLLEKSLEFTFVEN